MNRYVVLVCGLNIRDQNRISLEEQRLALEVAASELELARVVEDKGSYLVASHHPTNHVGHIVLSALLAHRPDLKIPGVAVISPNVVADALAALTKTLSARYDNNFTQQNYGIKLGEDIWRAGLALPLFPSEHLPDRTIFHKIKNAIIFGWISGCALVAKRQAKNVHWGKTVTGPASSQIRRYDRVVIDFTSRSANILRDLVG